MAFVVEILRGIGSGIPLVLTDASQIVVRLADGTPICVASVFGGDDAVLVSHCEDPQFSADLAKMGIHGKSPVVERIVVR